MRLFGKKDRSQHWQQISEVLMKLRGLGQWRGREIRLSHMYMIRFPFEALDKDQPQREIVLHLEENMKDLWAEEIPGGQKIYLSTFHGDLEKFLTEVLSRVRQRPYLRSEKDKATYRN